MKNEPILNRATVADVPRVAVAVALCAAALGSGAAAWAQTRVDDRALALRPSTTAAVQQSAQEALLTRRGFWTYQWQPTSTRPALQAGEVQALNVRYYPDGTYALSVQFAGAEGAANGERANNKGLWSISQTMYAALITEGPQGPLAAPLPGLLARVKSVGPEAMVLAPLQGQGDMVLSFKAAD